MSNSIHQNPVTLIAPIIPEKLLSLYEILKQIKSELLSHQHLEIENLGTIHFARWVIIDDKNESENPDHEKPKLVFTSNFDGDIQAHILALSSQAGQLFDRIYDACFGYPSIESRSPQTRFDYLISKNVPASSFYRGSPDRSLKQIRSENDLRNFLRAQLDSRTWHDHSAIETQKFLQDAVKSKPEFESVRQPFEMPHKNWPGLILLGIVLIILSPLLILLILIVQFFYERRDPYFTLTRTELNDKKIKDLESYEDIEYQNQFTQLVVMKSGFIRLFTFKFMMTFSRFLIKYFFVEGKLMGIPTIHFARWVLFDDNKRVLFFSNFDGSWQQYLGDFIDESGWGLTGIFSNTTNFPKTKFLFTGGAYDEEHFLAWSRNTELQTQAWYSAYPTLSIKNVNNNSKIRSLLFKDLNEPQAQAFLNLL